MADGAGDRHHAHLNLPGHHIDDGRTGAAIGHVHHVERSELLEQLERQVARAAVAGRAVAELARTGARRLQEVGEGLEVGRRMGGEHVRRIHRQRDRREIALGIERHFLEQAGVDQQRIVPDHERVAVGLGLGDRAGGDVAAAARPVVDDHPVRPTLAQPLRQDAGERIEAAARCRGHHDAHRPRGIVLRLARASGRRA